MLRIQTDRIFGRDNVPNKATAARRTAISASGEVPLDYMIRIMRDKSAPVERRDEMAKAAAPYVHPKLAAIEMDWREKSLSEMTNEELIAIASGGNGVTEAG